MAEYFIYKVMYFLSLISWIIWKIQLGNGGRQVGPNLACLIMLSQLMIQHPVLLSQHLARGNPLSQYLLYLWVHHLLLSTHNRLPLLCNHQHPLPKGELHLPQRAKSSNQYVYQFIVLKNKCFHCWSAIAFSYLVFDSFNLLFVFVTGSVIARCIFEILTIPFDWS